MTNKNIWKKRKVWKKGDLAYLGGSSTKVETLSSLEEAKVFCRVVECGENSKYKVNSTKFFSRRILYPRHERVARGRKIKT